MLLFTHIHADTTATNKPATPAVSSKRCAACALLMFVKPTACTTPGCRFYNRAEHVKVLNAKTAKRRSSAFDDDAVIVRRRTGGSGFRSFSSSANLFGDRFGF